MSTKYKVAISIVISLAVGFGVGAWLASRYWLDFNARFILSGEVARTEGNITTRIALIDDLRSGKSKDAKNLLEQLLDGDLMTAAALVKDGHKLSPDVLEAVAAEVRARKVSGYEPADPTVRAYLQKSLDVLIPGAKLGVPAK